MSAGPFQTGHRWPRFQLAQPPDDQPPADKLSLAVAAFHTPSRACALWQPASGAWDAGCYCAGCAYGMSLMRHFRFAPAAMPQCVGCKRELE